MRQKHIFRPFLPGFLLDYTEKYRKLLTKFIFPFSVCLKKKCRLCVDKAPSCLKSMLSRQVKQALQGVPDEKKKKRCAAWAIFHCITKRKPWGEGARFSVGVCVCVWCVLRGHKVCRNTLCGLHDSTDSIFHTQN